MPFYFKILSKYTQSASMATCFQKIIYGKYPIACVYLKYIYFYIKTCNFEKNLLRRFDENTRGVARI